MLDPQCLHDGWQEADRGAGEDAEPDYLAAGCGRAEVGTTAGKGITHAFGAAERDRTCFGGPHDARSGRALDEPRADDTLERGDLFGDGRL